MELVKCDDDKMKKTIHEIVKEIWKSEIILESCNMGVIYLIHKMEDKSNVEAKILSLTQIGQKVDFDPPSLRAFTCEDFSQRKTHWRCICNWYVLKYCIIR